MSLLVFFGVLFMVGFIVWQFKMLKKYVLTFDGYKMNAKEGFLVVNERVINFADITFVTVRELAQPSATEKMLSKSAYYAYMSEVIFHLHEGERVTCRFNTKGALYKALKQLSRYVPVNADIEQYKPRFEWSFLLLVAAGIILVMIFKSF